MKGNVQGSSTISLKSKSWGLSKTSKERTRKNIQVELRLSELLKKKRIERKKDFDKS